MEGLLIYIVVMLIGYTISAYIFVKRENSLEEFCKDPMHSDYTGYMMGPFFWPISLIIIGFISPYLLFKTFCKLMQYFLQNKTTKNLTIGSPYRDNQ